MQMLKMPVIGETITPFPDQVTYDCLSGALNHEIKDAMTLLFYSNYDQEQSGLSIARALVKAQGAEPAWEGFHVSGQMKQFCEISLEPLAHVVTGSKEAGWQASRDEPIGKLALAGFVADWSLRYPDWSVQALFGRANKYAAVKAPEVRYQVYKTLLETNNLSIIKLAAAIPGVKSESMHTQLAPMYEQGILEKQSVIGNNPHLKIVRTEIPVEASAELMTREVRALYDAMQQLGVGTVIAMNDLVDKALEQDDTIDGVLLRDRLHGGPSSGWLTAVQFVDHDLKSRDERSAISITEAARGPVKDLCKGIAAIQDGHDGMTRDAVERAKDILGTPEDFRALIAKGRSSSLNTKRLSPAENHRQLLSIVADLGSVNAEGLRAALGNRLLTPVIKTLMKALIEAGKVEVEQRPRRPHSRSMETFYRIKEEA